MGSPQYDFHSAHVLVTGGTSGIGAATARAYRDSGAVVTITGTRPDAQSYDTDLAGYRYLQMDAENPESIDAVAASLDRLDILVNNAGMALPSLGLDEYDPAIFERSVNMLLIGAFRMARQVVGLLSESRL